MLLTDFALHPYHASAWVRVKWDLYSQAVPIAIGGLWVNSVSLLCSRHLLLSHTYTQPLYQCIVSTGPWHIGSEVWSQNQLFDANLSSFKLTLSALCNRQQLADKFIHKSHWTSFTMVLIHIANVTSKLSHPSTLLIPSKLSPAVLVQQQGYYHLPIPHLRPDVIKSTSSCNGLDARFVGFMIYANIIRCCNLQAGEVMYFVFHCPF